jgi:DNA-binding MarR family transcriptional regulator
MLYNIAVRSGILNCNMSKADTTLAEPETNLFDGLLGYHLRRLSVLVMTDLTQALSPLDLKPADASVLFMIAANPGITQSEVGKALGILRANMAPLIGALLKRDLIEREPVDGRSQALTLSSSGQSLCRQARLVTQEHENRLFGTLSVSARGRLIAQLRDLWDRSQ